MSFYYENGKVVVRVTKSLSAEMFKLIKSWGYEVKYLVK
jgi:hypothetical protein